MQEPWWVPAGSPCLVTSL